MRARAFVTLQYLLPQHALSRLIYHLTRSHIGWLRRTVTRLFVAGFRPEMSDAVQPDPLQYDSFNSFFTRALRPGTRPMPADPADIACPVDGTVSMTGAIDEGLLLQAKDRSFTLDALLANRQPWVDAFRGGRFATIYLAPYNYHRVHMPMDGVLREGWFVPGKLFSVNAVTAQRVDALFARNERVICGFDGDAGPFAMVLVGALFVGSMNTVWHGEVTPARRRAVSTLTPLADAPSLRVPRGAELGRFNMGSTIILLLPPGGGEWSASLQPGRVVRLGETIGRRARK